MPVKVKFVSDGILRQSIVDSELVYVLKQLGSRITVKTVDLHIKAFAPGQCARWYWPYRCRKLFGLEAFWPGFGRWWREANPHILH